MLSGLMKSGGLPADFSNLGTRVFGQPRREPCAQPPRSCMSGLQPAVKRYVFYLESKAGRLFYGFLSLQSGIIEVLSSPKHHARFTQIREIGSRPFPGSVLDFISGGQRYTESQRWDGSQIQGYRSTSYSWRATARSCPRKRRTTTLFPTPEGKRGKTQFKG